MIQSELIKKLRNCSSIPGKQKTWISGLSDGQLFSLFKMLKRNQTAKSVAKYIQMKWGIKPKSSAHSLSQGIIKYRNRINHLFTSTSSEEKTIIDLDDFKRDTPLESLLRNEAIASSFRDRIDTMMREERELEISYPTLAKDIQSLTSFERIVLKQRETVIRHQGNDPLMYYQNAKNENEIAAKFGRLIDQIDDREKVAQALRRAVELVEEEDEWIILRDDGSTLIGKKSGIVDS